MNLIYRTGDIIYRSTLLIWERNKNTTLCYHFPDTIWLRNSFIGLKTLSINPRNVKEKSVDFILVPVP